MLYASIDSQDLVSIIVRWSRKLTGRESLLAAEMLPGPFASPPRRSAHKLRDSRNQHSFNLCLTCDANLHSGMHPSIGDC